MVADDVASVGRRPVDRRGRRFGIALFVVALLAVLLAPLSTVAQDSGQIEPMEGEVAAEPAADVSSTGEWLAPTTVYIPETGHSIDGVFLDYWRLNSGINNYGLPISPEHELDGRTVQYYEYARFEYWPEDPNGEVVKIGAIGEELRPKALPRSTVAGVGAASAKGVAAESSAMTKAWLPLDKKVAERENTDTWRYVPETRHSVTHGFKTWWEATGEGYLGNPLSEEYVLKGVTYQVFERGQLAWKKGTDVYLVPLGPVVAKKHDVSTAPVDQGSLPTYSEELFIPPATPTPTATENGFGTGNGGERWIDIDLTAQYLTTYEGDVAVNGTYVSTGRPGFDTPPGSYSILSKPGTETMEGVLGGEYYNVPDVPNTQYFTNVGHALHGAYWHNNFGAVMSHGCVNLPIGFDAWLFGWTSIGTRVEIHY